ncbi:MAG: hypothetical protein Q8M34_12150 [Thermodesulfovibrionales bacterium]|nr:hypothetical protein [Thermodesulfovibrionales bacterium]
MPYLRQIFKEMKIITAKNLKNRTDKVMRTEATKALEKASMRPFEEAWSDIENSLTKTKPHFKSAKEAMSWTRRRSLSS